MNMLPGSSQFWPIASWSFVTTNDIDAAPFSFAYLHPASLSVALMFRQDVSYFDSYCLIKFTSCLFVEGLYAVIFRLVGF